MRSHLVRLIRDGAVVGQDLQIASLRRLKDDVREVKAGLECGVNLLNYDDVKEADKLEFYTRQKVARTL
jgi:translation initiation factor IF-2